MPRLSQPLPELDDSAIERIALGLLDRTLPCAEWTHAAHFAAALWLLRHQPGAAAPAALRDTISAYNLACGKPNDAGQGYHHTITLASLGAARAVLARWREDSLAEMLTRLLVSNLGRADWLLRHWSRERLFSPEARQGWVAPDLRPPPFAIPLA